MAVVMIATITMISMIVAIMMKSLMAIMMKSINHFAMVVSY